MKKILGVLLIAGTLVACNNSADSEANTKDSLDSIANIKKDVIDSSADAKKDMIDSSTEAKKDAVDTTKK